MKNIVTYREADGGIINFEAHSTLKSPLELARYYASEKEYPDRYVVFTDRLAKLKSSKKDIEVESESGIFMSCILRPSIFPSQASLLSAMSATAMATAMEGHTDKPIGIGWVSDIYCDGVKIGGVNIEGKLDDYTAYEYIIISFNARINKDNFPPKLTDMVKKVFDTDNTSVNMIIARSILSKFFKLYPSLKTPERFMKEYASKFALRGRKVKYRVGDKWKAFKVLGIDARTGSLILDNGKEDEIIVTSPALINTPKKFRNKHK